MFNFFSLLGLLGLVGMNIKNAVVLVEQIGVCLLYTSLTQTPLFGNFMLKVKPVAGDRCV